MAKLTQLVIGLNVEEKTLLSWNKNFKIHPHNNEKGELVYSKEQVDFITHIHFLIKKRGFTIIGAKLELKKKGDSNEKRDSSIQKLTQIKGFLVELKDNI